MNLMVLIVLICCHKLHPLPFQQQLQLPAEECGGNFCHVSLFFLNKTFVLILSVRLKPDCMLIQAETLFSFPALSATPFFLVAAAASNGSVVGQHGESFTTRSLNSQIFVVHPL